MKRRDSVKLYRHKKLILPVGLFLGVFLFHLASASASSDVIFGGGSERWRPQGGQYNTDIYGAVAYIDSFHTLALLIRAAGLDETLKGKGPYTLFAPTDKAFAKLPQGCLQTLMEPENKAKLAAFLGNFVVLGKIMALDMIKMSSAKNIEGMPLRFYNSGNSIGVGRALILRANIEARNGVIHAIDSILVPVSSVKAIGECPAG
jgi:uncharacterized surface protein with fasciclin (FAS1) repeats